MDKRTDRSPFDRLHIPDTFENVLRAVVKGPKPKEGNNADENDEESGSSKAGGE